SGSWLVSAHVDGPRSGLPRPPWHNARHRMNNASSRQLVRAVGFWGLVAMCINAVVGFGVFLLPTESYKLLGPFSLWAPLLFAVPVFILVLCFAEAASHFSEPGGAYLYARTAFGAIFSKPFPRFSRVFGDF